MAFQFELVSPEKLLASFEASEVQIPGADGDLTAMANHSPVITTLRPGVLRAVEEGGVQEFAVTGGFAEITPSGASVLAERAKTLVDMTPALIASLIADAQKAAASATGEAKDTAEKLAADFEVLRSFI